MVSEVLLLQSPDCGKHLLVEHHLIHRTEASADHAVRVDQEGLRDFRDAPPDAGAAVDVQTDTFERVAVFVEEGTRRIRLVLVNEADHPDAMLARQLRKNRRLFPARDAPGGEHVDQRDATPQVGRAEARCARVERRQCHIRGRSPVQDGWNFIAAPMAKADEENDRDRDEQGRRNDEAQPAHGFSSAARRARARRQARIVNTAAPPSSTALTPKAGQMNAPYPPMARNSLMPPHPGEASGPAAPGFPFVYG